MELHGNRFRHIFLPAPQQVTVERELRNICARWQEQWTHQLQDHEEGSLGTVVQACQVATVGDLCNARLDARKEVIAFSTRLKERHYLQQWRDVLNASTQLADLNNIKLLEAFRALAKHLKPGTVNCSLATFEGMMAWACERGYIHGSPEKGLKKLKDTRDPTKMRWWTSDEVTAATGDRREGRSPAHGVAPGCRRLFSRITVRGDRDAALAGYGPGPHESIWDAAASLPRGPT